MNDTAKALKAYSFTIPNEHGSMGGSPSGREIHAMSMEEAVQILASSLRAESYRKGGSPNFTAFPSETAYTLANAIYRPGATCNGKYGWATFVVTVREVGEAVRN